MAVLPPLLRSLLVVTALVVGGCGGVPRPPAGGAGKDAGGPRGPSWPGDAAPDDAAVPSRPRGAGTLVACDPGAPASEAYAPGGPAAEGGAILPGGRRVAPVGEVIDLGFYPLGLVLSVDGSLAYVTHNGGDGVAVVDLGEGRVLETVEGLQTFRGVALAPGGRRLYVAGARSGEVVAFDVLPPADPEGGPPGAAAEGGTMLRPAWTAFAGGFVAEVETSADGQVVFALVNSDSTVAVLAAADGHRVGTFRAGTIPHDALATPDGRYLFVSNLGAGTVSGFDLVTGGFRGELSVGKNPEGMALDPAAGLLYVAAADDDLITVVDVETFEVAGSFDLSREAGGLKGASPVALEVDPLRGRLYAALAGLNRVEVLSLPGGERVGAIPTGWYPVAVRLLPGAGGDGQEGRRLAVLSARGIAAEPGASRALDRQYGHLAVVDLEGEAAEGPALDALTAEALAASDRPTGFYPGRCERPLPYDPERGFPVKHVVLVVRENKTYDMVLGDLPGANGDPALTLFGEEVTPNLHKLAREFVNLDNFYNNADNSLQGHTWTTMGASNDYVEAFRVAQFPIVGYEPAAVTAAGTLFDHLSAHGVPFRVYGEFPGAGRYLLDRYRTFVNTKYPFFNMEVPDVLKAREFIRELELGIFPSFVYLSLPNDHTFGTREGKPTPESMVADNDLATGLVVEAISRSPFWEETVLFIIEDDPQSWSGDHVDAHRSICVAVGPWVKRGYVGSVHYDIPALYRTILALLGLPPLNRNDASAPVMYDIFRTAQEGPDLRPYEAEAMRIRPALNGPGALLSAESAALDFGEGGVDGVVGLGRILWHHRKGLDVFPPPYARGIDR